MVGRDRRLKLVIADLGLTQLIRKYLSFSTDEWEEVHFEESSEAGAIWPGYFVAKHWPTVRAAAYMDSRGSIETALRVDATAPRKDNVWAEGMTSLWAYEGTTPGQLAMLAWEAHEHSDMYAYMNTLTASGKEPSF